MTGRISITLAAIAMLTGCSAIDIQTLTGSQPPLETEADQSARVAEIISRADSLILSTSHFETGNPDLPTIQIPATCSGSSCSVRAPEIGYYDTISISDLQIVSGTTDFSHSKHGITLFGGHAVDGSLDAHAFGSWMHHSTFWVDSASSTVDGMTSRILGAGTSGDLTGSSPNTSATWRGVVVGTPVTGTDRGDFLQGDATLSYDFIASGHAEIDAAFTDIKNIDRKRDHSIASIRFDDVPADTDGTFEAGVTGNHIQGGFYGPGHAETAGVFEQQGIVGSFGALR